MRRGKTGKVPKKKFQYRIVHDFDHLRIFGGKGTDFPGNLSLKES